MKLYRTIFFLSPGWQLHTSIFLCSDNLYFSFLVYPCFLHLFFLKGYYERSWPGLCHHPLHYQLYSCDLHSQVLIIQVVTWHIWAVLQLLLSDSGFIFPFENIFSPNMCATVIKEFHCKFI